ncbi:MAG: hypothetical protein ACI4SM_00200 [Candidatus Gastranaerophilaceae bacterium]
MIDLLITNLTHIGIAVGLFAIAYFANICFSIYYNIKILQQDFDITKLRNGILKSIAICLGISALTIVITLLPTFLEVMGIALPEDFISSFNIIAIIGAFSNSIYKYIKEAFVTLQDILNPQEGSDKPKEVD